ncbi:MAG TPA: UDP-N-acetylmuramoyl-tripeptide--D-alanyl-D-alanine ligase [Arachnia sp.]|nr:UDP-N-acetylmuramoyl-tripeptide--D-alanyl-D-alanine ligase [Arachnia sp.]HMT86335.1 UDP-N-acetylmuramoyl-tripeptide--D-alanyl-D-alanine ligase [Arachnia sp.]
MRQRTVTELIDLMEPEPAELFGHDAEGIVVGPDVVIDNRAATPGAVFVAIPGERVDGHRFAAAAAEAGACAVLGTYVTDADVPHVLCADTVRGLSALARGLVREQRARGMLSLGVTGSSGKTSTKDLLAQVLESAGPTVAPVGSQNNEIGVPLTACRIDDDTRFLVSEMGARGAGHLSWLTSLVPLDVAVVLNVGHAHIGEFGGIEQVAAAKSELVADLAEDGWAVLNADDPLVRAMAAPTRGRIAWVGEGELPAGELTVTAQDVVLDALSRASFRLVVTRDAGTERARTETAPVTLQVIGRHSVGNALSAAGAAVAAGLGVAQVADALSGAVARSAWRMALAERTDGALVLNDSYNANPDSMAAALRTVAELLGARRAQHPEAKAVAVLGDMLELGDESPELHRQVGRLAAELGIQEIHAIGDFAGQIVEGTAGFDVVAAVTTRERAAGLVDLGPHDVLLVKGSRGVGLETVADELMGKVTR